MLLVVAGGTADGTVVRVTAESGLLHQQAVSEAVHTIPIWKKTQDICSIDYNSLMFPVLCLSGNV